MRATAFDDGRSAYANPLGRSSIIINFATFTILRIGVTLAVTDATPGRFQGAL